MIVHRCPGNGNGGVVPPWLQKPPFIGVPEPIFREPQSDSKAWLLPIGPPVPVVGSVPAQSLSVASGVVSV